MGAITIRSSGLGIIVFWVFLFFVAFSEVDAGFFNLDSLRHGKIADTDELGITITTTDLGRGRTKSTISDWKLSTLMENNESRYTLANSFESDSTGNTAFDFNIPNLSYAFDLEDIEKSSTRDKGGFVELQSRRLAIEAMSFISISSRGKRMLYNDPSDKLLSRIKPLSVSEIRSWINKSISMISFDDMIRGIRVQYEDADSTLQSGSKLFTNKYLITVSVVIFSLIVVVSYMGFKLIFKER